MPPVRSSKSLRALSSRGLRSLALAATVAVTGVSANAGPISLQNGSFELTTATNTQGSLTVGSVATNSNLTGWTVPNDTTFNFIGLPNYTTAGIWDSIDGHYSSFNKGGPGVSPDGGNVLMADPGYRTGAISQNVTGLIAGAHYQLSFDQASMQQAGYTGDFTGSWKVGFGATTAYSSSMVNPSQTYTNWVNQTMSFTANASSQVLSFFATSNVASGPPFLLLDGITLVQVAVPEPATIGLSLVGIAGLLLARRRRAKTA